MAARASAGRRPVSLSALLLYALAGHLLIHLWRKLRIHLGL
ncbi:hypothetical protein ACFYWN_43470 [Streptomyces sp. NPDC002917]